MIKENATVVSIFEDALWVETIQQSVCGSCSAQKGCGQGVLAKYLSSSSFFRVQLDDLEEEQKQRFQIGDVVELGIDEFALVRASLWLYAIPLLGLMIGAYGGSLVSEVMSMIGAGVGLTLGGLMSAWHARKVQNDPDYAPILTSENSAIRIITQ